MFVSSDCLQKLSNQILTADQREPSLADTLARADAGVSGLSAEVVSMDRLSSDDRVAWQRIRRRRPDFCSPFFSVTFSDAVQAARGDVQVAVVRQGGSAIGFLPFHRVGKRGFPVGRFLNDAHNLIAESGAAISWQWLLDAIGLRTYEFHALAGSDPNGFPSHTCHETVRSYHCDIGDDSRAYLASLGQSHKTIGRQGQKTRKLGREIGPVSFEFDCRSPEALSQAILWKRQQYARTHILDLFSPPWTVRLMETLFDRPDPNKGGPRGVLSVLRSAGRIVASHYGMLENGRLHYWFPVYDPTYGRYSPGTGLFCSILEIASEQNIQCVDMGYGEQPYKLKQTDATGIVAQGCMARSLVYRHFRCIETRVTNAAKMMPAKAPLKRVWRTLWPTAGISKLN